jgi:hypothetical protein
MLFMGAKIHTLIGRSRVMHISQHYDRFSNEDQSKYYLDIGEINHFLIVRFLIHIYGIT